MPLTYFRKGEPLCPTLGIAMDGCRVSLEIYSTKRTELLLIRRKVASVDRESCCDFKLGRTPVFGPHHDLEAQRRGRAAYIISLL